MNPEFTRRLDKIEAVLHRFLPDGASASWRSASFGNIDPCIADTHIHTLIDPCRQLLLLGGKRWRPLLSVLCAELAASAGGTQDSAVQAKVEAAYELSPLIEFAHTASLIHDDIEDGADTRRGKPAAHLAFGLDVAINAASWLYFQAAACITHSPLPAERKLVFYELYLEELRRLHLGQAMDILWHRTPDFVPTRDEYTAMVRNKTGTLARLAVKVGILCGGGSVQDAEQCGAIAEDIGTGFQILDDVTNLTTGNPGKKRGDDIVEGKKSLPVLLYLEAAGSDRARLFRLFGQAGKEGISSPAVEEAISLLEAGGAIARAAEYGTAIINEKVAALTSFYGTADSMGARLIAELFGSMGTQAK